MSPLLLALAMQAIPTPLENMQADAHQELRDREPREGREDAALSAASVWLKDCLALIEEDAARAHTKAQIRRTESFGADRVLANHCLGLAASELGRWPDAITAFIAARDETPTDETRAKARFGTMAGNAALAHGDAVQAEAILTQAKGDAATAASASLQTLAAVDLARALVAQGKDTAGLAALEEATTLQPDLAEAWLLKATLLRRMERLDEAQTAIARAGELAPQEVAIGLEAGVIAILSGRDEAARASWQSVIDIQPDSAAASQARDYLVQLTAPRPGGAPPSPEDQDTGPRTP